MIGSGILLALTLALTVAWLYVEVTDVPGRIDDGPNAPDEDADLDA